MFIHQVKNSIEGDVYNAVPYSGEYYAPHFHKSFELTYVVRGTVNLKIGNEDRVLTEGSFAIVPPYELLTHIEGKVKRPMYYEMKTGETVKSLIEYAGNFTGDAYTKNVRITRQNGREFQNLRKPQGV